MAEGGGRLNSEMHMFKRNYKVKYIVKSGTWVLRRRLEKHRRPSGEQER